jgi:hypothetical protein
VARIKLKHVNAFANRNRKNARIRYYFRRQGTKAIQLPGLPGSDEFLAGQPIQSTIGGSRTQPGSVNALVIDYYRSTESEGLAAR